MTNTPDAPDYDGSDYGPRFRGGQIRCWKTQPRNLEEAKRAGWDGPGWYFFDETWACMHGPFETLKECQLALDGYVESL